MSMTCTAPELVTGEPFNGGTLVLSGPLHDAAGKYPGRVVLVHLGNEYATWVAAWPYDREVPQWYCTTGHYFALSDTEAATRDFHNRVARGY